MHFSIYARLLDLLWEHLDDEDRFRQLAHEAVERLWLRLWLRFRGR